VTLMVATPVLYAATPDTFPAECVDGVIIPESVIRF
jgi:hypothetical protein